MLGGHGHGISYIIRVFNDWELESVESMFNILYKCLFVGNGYSLLF